jgi:hypothetical protein
LFEELCKLKLSKFVWILHTSEKVSWRNKGFNPRDEEQLMTISEQKQTKMNPLCYF